MSRLGPDFQTWLRDDPRVRDAIERGEPGVEVFPTAYGENDFFLEFLMGSGLWELLVAQRPRRLQKDNGKPWRALNGLEVLRELAGVQRIAHCGKVLQDTRLMMIAGFNAEQVQSAQRNRRMVVTPETLGKHLARIDPRDATRVFYQQVQLLKQRRWLKPGVYAADAHEITFPHARNWEGMGQVGAAHGYKLVLLVRVDPVPEQIVGFALAPLPTSEHLLLRMVLRHLAQAVGSLRSLIQVLVLDRGYWGAEFLLGLRRRYGCHFVTRAQHEQLGVVQDVEGLLRDPEAPAPVAVPEERPRLGALTVQLRAFERVPLANERGQEVGSVQVVVADEFDPKGRPLREADGSPRPRFYYVTSLPVHRDPYRIRRYYLRRWVIENEGFRNLTQRWALDIPAGRNLSALVARLVFVLVLANAERLVENLFPGPWQEERKRLGKLGVQSRIGGWLTLAAYTAQGQLGLLEVDEYGVLVARRERARVLDEVRRGLTRGEDLTQLLERLGDGRPPPS